MVAQLVFKDAKEKLLSTTLCYSAMHQICCPDLFSYQVSNVLIFLTLVHPLHAQDPLLVGREKTLT